MIRNTKVGLRLARTAVKMKGLGEPVNLIGQKFYFGDGDHAIFGTITSIGLGPTEGVKLYVSAPRYFGINIKFLYKHGDSWAASGFDDAGRSLFKTAKLEFL